MGWPFVFSELRWEDKVKNTNIFVPLISKIYITKYVLPINAELYKCSQQWYLLDIWYCWMSCAYGTLCQWHFTRQVFYKTPEQLITREQLSSIPTFYGSMLLIYVLVFCVVGFYFALVLCLVSNVTYLSGFVHSPSYIFL